MKCPSLPQQVNSSARDCLGPGVIETQTDKVSETPVSGPVTTRSGRTMSKPNRYGQEHQTILRPNMDSIDIEANLTIHSQAGPSILPL